MDLLTILGNVMLAGGGLSLVIFPLYAIVLWARTRASGAYVLGAFLIPIGGMGNVSDPDFKIVNEARQLKREEEDDTGDPPNSEVDQALDSLDATGAGQPSPGDGASSN